MAKTASPNLTGEQIASIFTELKKLTPPKKPSLAEILADNREVIIEAYKRGHSLRDISTFLTSKGLKTSHETLRKAADSWGIISKNKRSKNVEGNNEQEQKFATEA